MTQSSLMRGRCQQHFTACHTVSAGHLRRNHDGLFSTADTACCTEGSLLILSDTCFLCQLNQNSGLLQVLYPAMETLLHDDNWARWEASLKLLTWREDDMRAMAQKAETWHDQRVQVSNAKQAKLNSRPQH